MFSKLLFTITIALRIVNSTSALGVPSVLKMTYAEELPFYGYSVDGDSPFVKNGIKIVERGLPDSGIHYAKAIYKMGYVNVVCADADTHSKNSFLQLYATLKPPTGPPNKISTEGSQFVAGPSISFPVKKGFCYVTPDTCSGTLASFLKKENENDSLFAGMRSSSLIEQIGKGLMYLRRNNWYYSSDSNNICLDWRNNILIRADKNAFTIKLNDGTIRSTQKLRQLDNNIEHIFASLYAFSDSLPEEGVDTRQMVSNNYPGLLLSDEEMPTYQLSQNHILIASSNHQNSPTNSAGTLSRPNSPTGQNARNSQ
ncbi:hypothetical protein BDF19DRAFT_420008 [Syncephalis fuscata]|nr:hypothetical protein BDF19DRAFT_420008 [Syncephalis fuscata]